MRFAASLSKTEKKQVVSKQKRKFAETEILHSVAAPVYLHVTLDSENTLEDALWCHPFNWQLFSFFYAVHVFVHLAHQTKVWHLHSSVLTNKDVPSCKVTMNEIIFGKVILGKNNEKKKCLKRCNWRRHKIMSRMLFRYGFCVRLFRR